MIKIFNKHKDNQDKIKFISQKRKILPNIIFALSLLFGRVKLSSAKSLNSNFYYHTIQERVIHNSDINSFDENYQQVILVKSNSNSSTIKPGLVNGFSSKPKPNPPAGARGLKSTRTRGFVTPSGIITGKPPVSGAQRQRTKLDGTGANNPGGSPTDEDQCLVSKEQKSQQSITHHHDFSQKNKKKKRQNQHLNRKANVDGVDYEFERYKIEKKTPSHGPDFGLDPDYGTDGEIIRDRRTGKPRAKQNKKNYEKFTENLIKFINDPKSEKIEPQYRKGRANEQNTVGFINRQERKFVIFDRETKKYITGWVMNDLQYQEFIQNNNII